jgi:uncharacterized protein YndB with AHSA1/START domain
MKDLITRQHTFQSPISLVWDARTLEEEISSWFIKADFKAEVGYHYTFTHENTRIVGDVLRVVPVTELIYTWKVEGTDVVTTVSWKLEEVDGGTLLTLEHSGISQYPGESAVVMFNNFEGGWDMCISNLGRYLQGR